MSKKVKVVKSQDYIIHLLFLHSGKPFDIANLMNPTGKDFDESQSSVLALIMGGDKNRLEAVAAAAAANQQLQQQQQQQ